MPHHPLAGLRQALHSLHNLALCVLYYQDSPLYPSNAYVNLFIQLTLIHRRGYRKSTFLEQCIPRAAKAYQQASSDSLA